MASVKEIKEQYLANPDKLQEFLEHWFYNVSIKPNYISFGRSEESSPTGLTIYLDPERNSGLYLTDYSRGIHQELFAYLIDHKKQTFKELMKLSRSILSLGDSYEEKPKVSVFGGIFDGIVAKKAKRNIKTYGDKILERYANWLNIRFLRDGIDLDTQELFDVRFDFYNQAIVFPIRNEFGDIIGIKARVNEDEVSGSKYYYEEKGPMSQTLFGFSENYSSLHKGTIYVFEAEKSVMQMRSMGFKNAVALGSSSLSDKQIELLLSLMPDEIVFCFDRGTQPFVIKKSIRKLYKYSVLQDFKSSFLDMEEASFFIEMPDKASPSDMGRDTFIELTKEFKVSVKREEVEDDSEG